MIVFKHNFGQETYGKIEKINDNYQCYETPLFGGEFYKIGILFDNFEKAKEFLLSLT